jgi:uncharacterized protein
VVLDAMARPLSDANLSLFALSTFDTDYILVRDITRGAALAALAAAGHCIDGE